VSAVDAFIALRAAVGVGECAACICDVDASSTIVATDALSLLRVAVGIESDLACTPCA
jgi:hypothetical protein